MVPVLVPVCQIRQQWRWSGVSLQNLSECPERYPAATKRLWTARTNRRYLIPLMSSALILDAERNPFPYVIQRRVRPSFDRIAFNWCRSSIRWDSWCHEYGLLRRNIVTLQYFSTSPSEKARKLRTKQQFQLLQAGYWLTWLPLIFNTLRPRQNGHHFADDMLKCIFLNENAWISIKISLKFVPKGSINNNLALFQIMAWRRPGDKPLSEPMMVSSLTHICITRPQWLKMVMCIQLQPIVTRCL